MVEDYIESLEDAQAVVEYQLEEELRQIAKEDKLKTDGSR
jgi:hypothetical protein